MTRAWYVVLVVLVAGCGRLGFDPAGEVLEVDGGIEATDDGCPGSLVAICSVMSGDVLVVTPVTGVEEIIDLMTEHKIGALPVVDNDSQLVGIVSYVDVLRAAGRAFAQVEPLLNS